MDEKISPKVIGAIIAAGIMSFSGVVVETSMNITFPTLMNEFNISTSTVQWMTTSYLLIVAMIVPISAILKRNFKTKNLFIIANLLFILGLALDAFAPNFLILLLGRIIQGFGTGIALPLMFNIILDQVPVSKIGMMMGIGSLITAIAPAIGPTFGGIVVSSLGWRFIFIFLLPLLIISLIVGLTSIQQASKIVRTHFDIPSFIWIIVTFFGLVFGFSNMGQDGFLSVNVILPILIGLIGLFLLVHRSNRIDHPIINLRVLTNHGFAGHVFSFFVLQILTLGLSFILPNYVQLVNGSSASLAGILVFPGAALGAVMSPFTGRILDKMGPKLPLMLGSALGILGLVLYTIFGMHLSNWMICVFYIIYMACLGLSFGNIMTNGLSYLPEKQNADGNAILTTLQQLAGAVGTSLVAAIVAQSQMAPGVNKALKTSIGSEHAFIFLLILVIIQSVVLFKVVVLGHKKAINK
ncbi:DHA2 family efflux MFS transporter permease subunit [Philodulcilactobacillus myokoensis]|nr:DHA2 family efflux MFS transporter permease subunit [Philodulcilactobacillus myokoensis]